MATKLTRVRIGIVLATLLALPAAALSQEREITRKRSGESGARGQGAGSGSIRHAERESRRNVRDRDGDRDADRDGDRDRDRERDRDGVRTRKSVSFGTSLTRMPRGAKEITIKGRRYFQHDDVYYVEARHGAEITYVVSRPPPGVYLRFLPEHFELSVVAGKRYYVADDVYYESVTYEGQPAYVVVDPPEGASIQSLPDEYETVVLRGGERLVCIGDAYYRPIIRRGIVIYIRVPAPQKTYDHVAGTVAYRERILLPADATVEIALLDISRHGAPAEVVAEQQIRRPGQVPIPFKLRFDTEDIDAKRLYAIQAKIYVDGRLRWINDNVCLVLTQGNPKTAEIIVTGVR